MRKLKEQLHSNRIKIILKEQGITQKQLSLLTKLNESHLSKTQMKTKVVNLKIQNCLLFIFRFTIYHY